MEKRDRTYAGKDRDRKREGRADRRMTNRDRFMAFVVTCCWTGVVILAVFGDVDLK